MLSILCVRHDKSKGGDTRELQSRMVPPQKVGRVTLTASAVFVAFWR